MSERRRDTPEPYGYWAVYGCGASACPVCLGACRHAERIFVPNHWQSGPPGQIAPL